MDAFDRTKRDEGKSFNQKYVIFLLFQSIKNSLTGHMQPNPAQRFEKALFDSVYDETVINDLLDRPPGDGSTYKELSLCLFQAASELEGVSALSNILKSVAEAQNTIARSERHFRQTTKYFILE